MDQTTPIRIFRERLEERKAAWSKTGENPHLIEQIDRELEFLSRNRVQDADALPRDKRRLIKSHLPFSLMPQNLLQKAKVIPNLPIQYLDIKVVLSIDYLCCSRSTRRRRVLLSSSQTCRTS